MCDAEYKFIIDTNSYAGNFERELCAYVTGHWDNETHGGAQAAEFTEEIGKINPFDDYIGLITNEHGLQTPVSLENTPKELKEPGDYSMCSIGIHFDKRPTPELIQIMKDRAYKFENEGLIFDRPVKLKILSFRLQRQIVEIVEEKL